MAGPTRPGPGAAPGLQLLLPCAVLLLLLLCPGVSSATSLFGVDAAAAAAASSASAASASSLPIWPHEGRSGGGGGNGDLLPSDAAARQLLRTALDGPLPGLTLIPGFPGMGGRKPGSFTGKDLEQLRRLGMLKLIKNKVKDDDKGLGLGIGRDGIMDLDLGKGLGMGIGDGGLLKGFRFKDDDLFDLGRDGVLSRRGGGSVLGSGAVGGTAAGAIGTIALADYVIRAQDPLAILLRQLSIVAIEAIGIAVANSIDRGVLAIDLELGRYSDFLVREVDALADSNLEPLVFAIQQQIRELVIVRAALADTGDRLKAYFAFLSASTSSWVSYIYGIQYRFQSLIINIDTQNDPFSVEINRVLYSLADVTKLIGLLIKPFIKATKFSQSYFASLYTIIFEGANRYRDRFTVTPAATLTAPLGSGENINVVINEILSLAKKVGTGENAAQLLQSAAAARDQVAAALSFPGRDGNSPQGIFASFLSAASAGGTGVGLGNGALLRSMVQSAEGLSGGGGGGEGEKGGEGAAGSLLGTGELLKRAIVGGAEVLNATAQRLK